MMHTQESVLANGGSMAVVTPHSSESGSEKTLLGPSNSGETYFTRDMLTEPPTVVQIVPGTNSGLALPKGAKHNGNTPCFTITYADIEPTAGWLSDRNNASLDICFMHSFGKCSGKARDKDPRTCHQIHVKRAVLDKLRKSYVNPQRHYFCRTIKSNVTEKFGQVLSLLARRRFALQYLEFKTEDVDVTAGSTAYEVEYRHWLVSEATPKDIDSRPVNSHTDNFISTSDLCWDFALTGRCAKGAACPDIHGHIAKALTKDRYVRMALEEMGNKECPTGNTTQRVTAPHDVFTPPQSLPMPSSTTAPQYYGAFTAQMAANSMGFLPPPPPPPPQTLFQTVPIPPQSSIPGLQNTPLFFVSEGDNVVRLMAAAPFNQYAMS